MITTRFGYEIIKSAEDVLGVGYRSFGKNYYGDKLEYVIKEFDKHNSTNFFAGRGKQQPDYCAITASVILDKAFRNYNNSHNEIRSASANTLSNIAKSKGVRVDKKPAVGSLFIYKRNDKGQGHIGFVWKVKSGYIETIEGNTESSSSFIIKNGCATKLNSGEYGILTRQRKSPYITSAGKEYQFIHIEELLDKELLDFPASDNYLADNNFCELMPSVKEMDFGGSDGDAPEAVETNVFNRYKDKIVLASGAFALILLGIYSKLK